MAKSGKSSGKPNILVIFGDDIGMWNVGAYSHGMMGEATRRRGSKATQPAGASP